MQYQQQAPQYPTGQPHFPPRQQGAYGPPQNRAFRDGPDTQPPNSYPLRDLQPSPYAQNAQQPHSQSPGHGMSPGFNPAIRTNPFNNHHYGSGFSGVDSEDESLNPPNRRDTTFSSSSQNSLFHGNDSEGKFFFLFFQFSLSDNVFFSSSTVLFHHLSFRTLAPFRFLWYLQIVRAQPTTMRRQICLVLMFDAEFNISFPFPWQLNLGVSLFFSFFPFFCS